MRIFRLLASLILLACIIPVQAQDATVTLVGHVVSLTEFGRMHVLMDSPAPGVTVTLTCQGKTWQAEVGMDGDFTIEGILPGIASVSVEKKGSYGDLSEEIVLSPGMHFLYLNLKTKNIINGKPVEVSLNQICTDKDEELILATPLTISMGGRWLSRLKALPGVTISSEEAIDEQLSFSAESFRWAIKGEVVLFTPAGK